MSVPALADTSVLVDYLRGVEAARNLIRPVLERGDVVASSALTRIELSIGTRREQHRKTDALVAAIQWIGIDAAIADDADQLARRYGRSHSGIDSVGYCIAATARVRQLDLWTLNVERFPMFPELRAPW